MIDAISLQRLTDSLHEKIRAQMDLSVLPGPILLGVISKICSEMIFENDITIEEFSQMIAFHLEDVSKQN